jgi:DNA recombination protein RmuC
MIYLAFGGMAAAAIFLWLYVRATTELAAARARLETERAAADDKLRLLDEARQSLKDTFCAVSADVLKSNSETFLQLAHTELDAKRGAIEKLVDPLKESMTKVDAKLQQVDAGRISAQAQLATQLQTLRESHQSLQSETNKLVRALRSPNQRGRWGEIQLRNIIERAGMTEYCGDFTEKDAAEGDDGRRSVPDMTVRLPNGACIVIDSKVPIDAYLTSIEEADEGKRDGLLRTHAKQVRMHIKGLGGKSYWARFTPTPELVVMFVPGEPLFSAALQADPTLFDYAADQRVIPASPLTLLALLRTVASAWQHYRLAQSAEEIRSLGTELYERLAVMAEYVADVGMNLRQAGAAYDRFLGSLESRVLVTARRFRDLGVSATKEMPDTTPLALETREPRATELRVPVQESLIEADVLDDPVEPGLSEHVGARVEGPALSDRVAAGVEGPVLSDHVGAGVEGPI